MYKRKFKIKIRSVEDDIKFDLIKEFLDKNFYSLTIKELEERVLNERK